MQEQQTREARKARADVDPAYIALGERDAQEVAPPQGERRPDRDARFARGLVFVVGFALVLAAAAILGGVVAGTVVFLAVSAIVILFPRAGGG